MSEEEIEDPVALQDDTIDYPIKVIYCPGNEIIKTCLNLSSAK